MNSGKPKTKNRTVIALIHPIHSPDRETLTLQNQAVPVSVTTMDCQNLTILLPTGPHLTNSMTLCNAFIHGTEHCTAQHSFNRTPTPAHGPVP